MFKRLMSFQRSSFIVVPLWLCFLVSILCHAWINCVNETVYVLSQDYHYGKYLPVLSLSLPPPLSLSLSLVVGFTQVINKTVLVVARDNLDYERLQVEVVEVLCWDTDGLSYNTSFLIEILDVNEDPYDLHLDNDTIPEDLEPGQAFAALLAKDPDNEIVERQNITYSMTELNSSISHFELVNGSVLVAKTSFDYEIQSKYILNVTATDSGTPPLTVWKIITIQVSEERQNFFYFLAGYFS